jgi:hypothetical protein
MIRWLRAPAVRLLAAVGPNVISVAAALAVLLPQSEHTRWAYAVVLIVLGIVVSSALWRMQIERERPIGADNYCYLTAVQLPLMAHVEMAWCSSSHTRVARTRAIRI